jgi:hypothetical protein
MDLAGDHFPRPDHKITRPRSQDHVIITDPNWLLMTNYRSLGHHVLVGHHAHHVLVDRSSLACQENETIFFLRAVTVCPPHHEKTRFPPNRKGGRGGLRYEWQYTTYRLESGNIDIGIH